MASGKKGKKTKGKTLALTEFLQETTGSIPVQPIRKSTSNWADEVEDDVYDSRKPVNVVLPTAPKASRDYDDITDKVPKDPPFCAYLSNLPYDVDEDEIAAFFKNMRITSMRIPRDDRNSDGPRSKGYGYIEFENRESLLDALVMRDTTLKNRRMRIEVASSMDNDRRRTGRMDIGRDRSDRGESSGDWRSGPRAEPTTDNDRRSGFNRDREGGGGFGREREGGFTREGMRNPDREDRSFNRDNMREGGGFNRDRDSGRDSSFRRDRDVQEDRLTNWRDGDRSNKELDRDRERDRDRGFNRDRGNFRDSDRGRFDSNKEDRRGYGSRRFENDRDGISRDRDDRDSERVSSEPRERPKLLLAPRTKPIESVPVKESVPSAAIFGNAKPVDTTQREKEIEEKLAREHSDPKSDNKDRRTHHSAERKSPERNVRRTEDSPQRDSRDGPSPRRVSPRRSPSRRMSPRRSPTRRMSPRRSPSRRTSPRRSPPRRTSPRRSPSRRTSPRRSSPRRFSPRRKSPKRQSPRRSSPRRNSPKRTPPRTQSPKRNFDEKKPQPKNDHKSPEKNDRNRNEKPKRDEKRDRHDKELPKMTEPEPPNFAANNKFAFLQTDDNSD